jgi:outer membrane protein assembly factor BamD (BamD/ComL family)
MRKTTWLLVANFCWGAGCAAGCNGQLSPEAQKLLAAGKLAYKNGDDVNAVRNMELFLKDNVRSKQADEAFYCRGLAKYRMGNLAGAKADLQEALDRAGSKPVKIASILALGDLAYDTNDTTVSEKMYQDVLKEIDRDKKPADQASYRLGCTLQRQGRWTEADSYFDRVMFLFDGTELARRSAQHVRCRAWTIQAGAYGEASRADAVVGDLTSKKLPAERRMYLRDGKPIFLVSVGRYPTFKQAEADLPKVKHYYADAFITTTR